MMLARLFVALVALGTEAQPLPPNVSAWPRVLAVVGGTALLLLAAAGFTRWTVAQLIRARGARFLALRRARRVRLGYHVASLGLYLAAILVLQWKSIVYSTELGGWLFLNDVVVFLPLLAAELIGSALFTKIDAELDRATRVLPDSDGASYSRWLEFRSEHAPWLSATFLTLVISDVVSMLDPAWTERPAFALVGLTLLAFVALVFMPFLLRKLWSTHPLPAGPLRELLEGWARHERVGISQILVWKSPHRVANAAVTGLIPGLRYVLLSESLLESLGPFHLLGIFGHEIGHVRLRHIWTMFALMVLGLWALVLGGDEIDRVMREYLGQAGLSWSFGLEWIPSIFWLSIPFVFGGVFTFSRRFEKEADLAGCRALSHELIRRGDVAANVSTDATEGAPLTNLHPEAVRAYISGLEQVAYMNGIDPNAWNWRHGRLSDRLAFLGQVFQEPNLAGAFHRRTKWFCRGTLALLALLAVTLLVARID